MLRIIKITEVQLYFLPVNTRVPLKFGTEILKSVTCARVRVEVVGSNGKAAIGWGETPLSVQWGWPSSCSAADRQGVFLEFCRRLAAEWVNFPARGHPIEIGHAFQEQLLPRLLQAFNQERRLAQPSPAFEPMPQLAALICCSAFDIALHDAFANLGGIGVYETYGREHMESDLAEFLKPAADHISFSGLYPADFLLKSPRKQVKVWHLVGGLDPLEQSDCTGDEPEDGYPVVLKDWIRADGLECLKVKLRGDDADWDLQRLVKVGSLAAAHGVKWLSADFNCTVNRQEYVIEVLEELLTDHPSIYALLLYVEQPFPYDLENNRIDVHAISSRKPLFLDESAHDWKMIRAGRSLGWNGVALKTCKTQTGAILSACWAKAHGMSLMVQDLTNPMLAQIPHVLLAANLTTLMGVESNAMQFYPDASKPESVVHPGVYSRRGGELTLDTIKGTGFGYRLNEIPRSLPVPDTTAT